MRHLTQDELVLYFYREMKEVDARQAEVHLAGCEPCRRELVDLEHVLAMAESLPLPERGDTYGAEVWARICPRLDPKPAWRWTLPFPLRTWALAAGAAALMVAAFWGGRIWQQRQAPTVAAIPEAAHQRILMVAVGDHLERAQMLLVEVMHQETEGPVDVSQTRQIAQDLVASNRLYRQTAVRDGDPRMANVLDELERVLLNIAHSPSEISAEELTSLQRQIAAQGILFKVRVVELEVRQQQKTAAPRGQDAAL